MVVTPELLRVRLDLAYDGTDFHGWAAQPGLRTVQGELRRALRLVARLEKEPVVVCAGRTDAGVHARGQVAHVDLPVAAVAEATGLDRVEASLRGVLSADIAIRRIWIAPPGFDARFAALARRYSYRVADNLSAVDPLVRGFTLWHRGTLDLDAMNAAAIPLTGLHDFAAFCRYRPGSTSIRNLSRLRWRREIVGPDPASGENPGVAVLDIESDAFCHSMVRSLVGVLLPVGEGRKPVDWPLRLLQKRQRDPGIRVMPAHPLVLEQVRYPPASRYADRVAQTRALRE